MRATLFQVSDKEQVATDLIRHHFEVEPYLVEVWRILRGQRSLTPRPDQAPRSQRCDRRDRWRHTVPLPPE